MQKVAKFGFVLIIQENKTYLMTILRICVSIKIENCDTIVGIYTLRGG
jgi:hypothetical protein